MRERACERCAGERPMAYTLSPFPRVGGFWLCAPCRGEWLQVQEVPSLDTASPPAGPALRSTPVSRMVWTRAANAEPRHF